MAVGNDGSLYGVTTLGGAFGHGTIFKVETTGRISHNLAGKPLDQDPTTGGITALQLHLRADGASWVVEASVRNGTPAAATAVCRLLP